MVIAGVGLLALAGAGAWRLGLFGGSADQAWLDDVTALGVEVAAQTDGETLPLVQFADGTYTVGAASFAATVDDPTPTLYLDGSAVCVQLASAGGATYHHTASGGAASGSCAGTPVTITVPELDATLTSSPYWYGLAVGDCVDDLSSASAGDIASSANAVSEPAVVPCTDPHFGEVYAIASIGGDAAPNAAVFRAHVADLCEGPAFTEFVGVSNYLHSTLFAYVLYPSEAAWGSGGHEMVCLLVEPGGTTTGSLKGSGR